MSKTCPDCGAVLKGYGPCYICPKCKGKYRYPEKWNDEKRR